MRQIFTFVCRKNAARGIFGSLFFFNRLFLNFQAEDFYGRSNFIGYSFVTLLFYVNHTPILYKSPVFLWLSLVSVFYISCFIIYQIVGFMFCILSYRYLLSTIRCGVCKYQKPYGDRYLLTLLVSVSCCFYSHRQ